MVRASTETTLLNIGIIGALAAAAYLIWNYFLKAGGSTIIGGCPVGQHIEDPTDCGTMSGLPRVLCDIGSFVIGAGQKCVADPVIPVIELPRDEHGCYISTQHWCPNDNQCRDVARACTPDEIIVPRPTVHPECYEWDPSSGTWQWSDSYCPYVPTPPTPIDERTKQCPDGQYYYPEEVCPPYVQPIPTKSCTCHGVVHELTEAEAAVYGSCGNYCDVMHPVTPVTPHERTKQCPDGQYYYPEEVCPPYVQPIPTKSCTCHGVVHDVTEAEAAVYGSCGNYCDVMHPVTPDGFPCSGGAILWKCPTGWRNLGWMDHGYCCKPQ